ncbi:MAG: MarR family transcriptional regulator [Candidatus Omnitrophica bacterium]|nr:MarR family transcriptional regulator [Candidatus Omnitrophota bacterium]
MKDAQEELDKKIGYYWQRIRAFGESHKHFDWNAMEVLLNLTFTHNLLDSVLSQKTREYGLSRAALNVLSILNHSEGKKGCKHHEISKLLLVSRANITGLIDGLIRQGLVERVYDENDRRICIARISKKGEELVGSFLPKYYEYAAGLFLNLSDQEKQQLNGLLVKMRSSINDKLKKSENEKLGSKKTKHNK